MIRKPGAESRGGIVAAQNGVAARVGAEILAAGGTAVDAVVATAFALAVREPWNSGLGGIGHHGRASAPAAGVPRVVDFGPVAPHAARSGRLSADREHPLPSCSPGRSVEGDRNMHGPLSFAIPSAVRGYAAAVERFGRLPWRELVEPAVPLAWAGLPVDWY